MRLTTKFSAFITLLTSLTIFVTLIGASLSFYNGSENKVENRVQAVATMLDNRLITTSFDKLEPQLDELMTPIEIVHIDFMLNGKPLYSHSRPDSYRPLGSHEQFREITVQSLKHPGITLHLVYVDPMVNYFRSLSITCPAVDLHWLHGGNYFLRRPLDPPPAGRPGAAGAAFHAYPERRARAAGARVGL